LKFISNKADENEEKEQEQKEETELLSLFLDSATSDESPKSRSIMLYSDIDEDSAPAITSALLSLKETGEYKEPENPDDKECEELITKYEPIKMYISTHGGSAHDMFAIYDVMNLVQKDCEIETYGIGKIMSAGVLILAAGTKGKRKIGANCRVMIHPVNAASMGDIHDIENDTKEIKVLQKQYVKSLSEKTNMTEKYVKSLIRKKVNTYFSAEDAVRLGIVDEII